MKFLEATTDIPDELISETLSGRAVFLCGAGISMRIGLPSFKKLTELIYEELGETFEQDPHDEPYRNPEIHTRSDDRFWREAEIVSAESVLLPPVAAQFCCSETS